MLTSYTSVDKLRKLYPKHAVVVTDAYDANILGLPGLSLEPLDLAPPISQPIYIPLPRSKDIPGFLVNSIIFGAFHAKWLVGQFLLPDELNLTYRFEGL